MFNNYKPLVNEVNDMNAQGGQLRNVCIIVFFLFYDGWNGQNCCQIKLGNKTMSCKSTHSLLLHDSLIKLFILSMSSVWKKEVNNVFSHHAYDYYATVLTLENNNKKIRDRVKRNNGISHFVKPTCTTKIIHYIESYFKTKILSLHPA